MANAAKKAVRSVAGPAVTLHKDLPKKKASSKASKTITRSRGDKK